MGRFYHMRKHLAMFVIGLSTSLIFFYNFNAYVYKKSDGVPILMYHEITPDTSKRYSVTPDNFREQLKELYQAGYVTARLEDVLLNKESVRNKKVVILRFDDSRRCHFNYIKNDLGKLIIDPDCAVGIILDFYKEHPDFGCHALFCVVATEEFHQPNLAVDKLRFLLEHGMEIGNHTYAHEHLINTTAEDIDRIFGKAMEHWQQTLGEDAQKIKVIALPYGDVPLLPEAQERLRRFTWKDHTYAPLGILHAGRKHRKRCPWASSPNHKSYQLPSFDVNNNNFSSIMKSLKE